MAKLATFTDTFDTKDTSKWSYNSNCTVNAGRLRIDNSDELVSVNTYDITSSYGSVKIDTPGSVFQFLVGDDNTGALFFHDPSIGLGAISADWSVFRTASYNATNHRWLRIREQSGTVYWETSPNGTTWSTFVSGPVPLSDVSVLLLGNGTVFAGFNAS